MKKFIFYALALMSVGLTGCSPDPETASTGSAKAVPAKPMAPMPGAVPFEREVLTAPASDTPAQEPVEETKKAAVKP